MNLRDSTIWIVSSLRVFDINFTITGWMTRHTFDDALILARNWSNEHRRTYFIHELHPTSVKWINVGEVSPSLHFE